MTTLENFGSYTVQKEKNQACNDDYKMFVHKSRYARYLPDFKRRETWAETVERYCDFWLEKYPIFPYNEVYDAILNMDCMPSMRALMTAGKALDRDNMAGFNCSYTPIDKVSRFDEILYILMCGKPSAAH